MGTIYIEKGGTTQESSEYFRAPGYPKGVNRVRMAVRSGFFRDWESSNGPHGLR